MRNAVITLGLLLAQTPCFAQVYTGGVTYDRPPVLESNVSYTAPVRINANYDDNSGNPTDFRLQLRRPRQARVQQEICAFGIGYYDNGFVYAVEPTSDVYDTVHPGDIIVSIDGMNPYQYSIRRKNYGDQDTVAEMVILTADRQTYTTSCARHPVSTFSPQFRSTMRTH